MGLCGKGEAQIFSYSCKTKTLERLAKQLTTHYFLDEPTHGLRSYNPPYQGP